MGELEAPVWDVVVWPELALELDSDAVVGSVVAALLAGNAQGDTISVSKG